WQLLEINSDTPAGLWETGLAVPEVMKLHGRRAVGGEFWPALAAAWRTAVAHALGDEAPAAPLTAGLVGVLACQEDADQIRAHARAAREALPRARIAVADMGELRVTAHAAHLRSARLDVLFRYYPLDWCAEPEQHPWLALVADGRLAMVPPATSVASQSKAFLALLHELNDRGFFPPEDAAAIRSYLPPTALAAHRLGRTRWVAKPFLEREGHGVQFSRDLASPDRRRLGRADVVFQRELDLVAARIPIGRADGWKTEERFLVFGVFLAGEEIAGVYTRAGARITGREAVCIPVALTGR